MNIQQMTQRWEIKFWDLLTPIIAEEGPLMKKFHLIKINFRTKTAFLWLLGLVWAAVGFVSGMILGRVIDLLQFL